MKTLKFSNSPMTTVSGLIIRFQQTISFRHSPAPAWTVEFSNCGINVHSQYHNVQRMHLPPPVLLLIYLLMCTTRVHMISKESESAIFQSNFWALDLAPRFSRDYPSGFKVALRRLCPFVLAFAPMTPRCLAGACTIQMFWWERLWRPERLEKCFWFPERVKSRGTLRQDN